MNIDVFCYVTSHNYVDICIRLLEQHIAPVISVREQGNTDLRTW